MTIKNFKVLVFSMVMLLGLVLSNMVQADSIVMKAYKKDFPEEQLKCMNCHMAAYPWHHPWNAYGQTVKKAINAAGVADKPTSNDINKIADILKQIGKSEDFKETTVKQ